MNKTPQIVPYKDIPELAQLRDWFYDFDETKDNRYRAIQKVSSYHTRGNVPHSIEATYLLTSSVLLDNESYSKTSNPAVIQLSYTMSIIKFVNGLLDPYQKSNFAMSLHKLAEILQLPSYFVELRHIGTHEYLPSIEMLRISSRNALQWLWENYWSEVLKESEELLILDKSSQDQMVLASTTEIDAILQHVKILRKMRKENISKTIKYGDSSEVGKKYWESMRILKSSYSKNSKLFIDILLFKGILIVKKEEDMNHKKINGIRLIYKPILEELGEHFNMQLFERLLELLSRDSSNGTDGEADADMDIEKDINKGLADTDLNAETALSRTLILYSESLTLKTENERSQAYKWIEHQLSNSLTFGKNSEHSSFVNDVSLNKILYLLVSNPNENSAKLFEILSKQNRAFLKAKKLDSAVIKAQELAQNRGLQGQDIGEDMMQLCKKDEAEKTEGTPVFMWDEDPEWTARGFGTLE